MIYTAIIFFVVIIYIFVNYGNFVKTILRWTKKPVKNKKGKLVQPEIQGTELVSCYIPIYQVVVLRKALYYSAPVYSVLSCIGAIGILLNLFNKFIFAINPLVMLICNVIMIVCTLLVMLLYGIATADCSRMYNFGAITTILCFLFPVLWCWYLNLNIPAKMRALQKEDTFSEHNGDTVIKSRHN